jgi:hypothetical protein
MTTMMLVLTMKLPIIYKEKTRSILDHNDVSTSNETSNHIQRENKEYSLGLSDLGEILFFHWDTPMVMFGFEIMITCIGIICTITVRDHFLLGKHVGLHNL